MEGHVGELSMNHWRHIIMLWQTLNGTSVGNGTCM